MQRMSTIIPQANDRLTGPLLGEPISINELLTSPPEPVEWLVQDLIPAGNLVVFSGRPGDYKTFVELHLAVSIAAGEPVFGHFETTKSSVLIVDEENSKSLLRSRLGSLSADNSLQVHLMIREGVKVNLGRHMLQIKKFVLKHDIKLVCFDSLVRIHSGDENSAVDMSKVFESFRPLLKHGVTILFTHHHRKESAFQSKNASQSLRGSSDILASVDCHLMIERNREESKIKITQNKLRVQEELKPFEVKVVSLEDKISFEYAGEITEVEIKRDLAKPLILKAVENGEKSQQELKLLLKGKIGGNAAMAAIRELVEDGQLIEKSGAKNKKSYIIPGEQNQLFS